MHTEIRKAHPARELRSLLAFDRAVFRASDRFPPDYWKQVESYWMLVGGVKVGCCAFQRNADFREAGENVPMRGSLYIASTAIHPRFRTIGLGRMLKSWQICFALRHRFTRIVTNVRAGNTAMLALNAEFGFKAIRTTPRYYSGPVDSTVVMERRFNSNSGK